MDNKLLTIQKLRSGNLTLSVAESCTGGKIASDIVSFEGVSDIFLGGVVTYSIDSKIKILKIEKEKLLAFEIRKKIERRIPAGNCKDDIVN